MDIPDFQSLMLPALRRLSERRWTTTELVEALADEHGLDDAARSTRLPSGRQTTIANRIHWALAHLNKAGLITRVARGQYEASPRGTEVLVNPPSRLTISYLQRWPDYAAFRNAMKEKVDNAVIETDGSVDVQNRTPEELLEAADRRLKIELAATLRARLQNLSPSAFEQLIIDVLVKIGYGGSRREAAERLGRSGDGGVDGVIREDVLGLDTIYLQAKRYAEDNAVGAPDIQGFAGALLANGATKGVFVTTGRFTSQARQVGSTYKTHRIVLIDGAELAQLMIEHKVGVRTIQIIQVQRLALEAYEDNEVE